MIPSYVSTTNGSPTAGNQQQQQQLDAASTKCTTTTTTVAAATADHEDTATRQRLFPLGGDSDRSSMSSSHEGATTATAAAAGGRWKWGSMTMTMVTPPPTTTATTTTAAAASATTTTGKKDEAVIAQRKQRRRGRSLRKNVLLRPGRLNFDLGIGGSGVGIGSPGMVTGLGIASGVVLSGNVGSAVVGNEFAGGGVGAGGSPSMRATSSTPMIPGGILPVNGANTTAIYDSNDEDEVIAAYAGGGGGGGGVGPRFSTYPVRARSGSVLMVMPRSRQEEIDSAADMAYWGWVVLCVTWIVFVVGMGSVLGVWEWAWDVGESPFPESTLADEEDEGAFPIPGYYPALIILSGVMAWVWVVAAWVGMKYFKHAKIQPPSDDL